MRVLPMPEGAPGVHQGISHTIKHYLSPPEMWEDVADGVPEAVRPARQSERLERLDPGAWARMPRANADLSAAWGSFAATFREGYWHLVEPLLAAMPAPPAAPWVRDVKGVWRAHAGDGIVVEVTSRGGEWHLWTALRPSDFVLRDYRCPPRDPRSVSLRRKLAIAFAARKVARTQEP